MKQQKEQRRLNISRIVTRLRPNRKHKDRLFQRVFADKKDLLDLYNAVNNTTYTNPDELEITTLEDVIYISMKNDMSFIISSTLNLYEHQSTVNPNMPIRGLMYFARLYEVYINKHNLEIYRNKLVELPAPQFVVFYNGREKQPDEQLLKLSDAFVPKQNKTETMLECKARVINTNYGHNKKLLEGCKRLHDYSYFIAKVNMYVDKKYSLKNAVRKAMEHCIENDILSDILIKCKGEVFAMLLTEFNEKRFKKAIYEDGYEDGIKEGELRGRREGELRGRREGELKGRREGRLEERDENLSKTIDLLKSLNLPNETIIQMISEKYGIPEEYISQRL